MNAVFQYWLSKPFLPGAEAGAAAMAAYAKQIGSDYHLAREPFMDRHGVNPRWFDKLRPVWDPAFDHYERVLIADVDIWPVEGLTANIWDEATGDFQMCEEPDQPQMRQKWPTSLFSHDLDQRWATWVAKEFGCDVRRDHLRRPLVFNAGLIALSRGGMFFLRANTTPRPQTYVERARAAGFPETYCTEQSYLNMVAARPFSGFAPLSVEWNRQIHRLADGSKYDRRTENTRFVHVMFRGADHNNAEWHRAIVNAPLP